MLFIVSDIIVWIYWFMVKLSLKTSDDVGECTGRHVMIKTIKILIILLITDGIETKVILETADDIKKVGKRTSSRVRTETTKMSIVIWKWNVFHTRKDHLCVWLCVTTSVKTDRSVMRWLCMIWKTNQSA